MEAAMKRDVRTGCSRREFLTGPGGAGGFGLFGLGVRSAAAEPPPETTTIQLVQNPALCFAPQFVAQGTDWRFLNELRKELKG
jgi:hypothetical protein